MQKTSEEIFLSVVIPAYNESKNLKKGVLDEVYSYMKDRDYVYEVLLVDDGSKDDTVELIKEQINGKKGFRLLENLHGGKAITVMTGMIESKGKIAIFTDLDQATPISELEKILPKFNEGYDIVIGSRHGRKGAPVIRKLMAWGFSLVRTILLGLPFKDTQCGFKGFTRDAVNGVFPEMLSRWKKMVVKGAAVNAGFDVETLFLAKKKDFKIAEVPVEWHYVGTERVQLVGDSLDAIADMLRIRFNSFFGKYNS